MTQLDDKAVLVKTSKKNACASQWTCNFFTAGLNRFISCFKAPVIHPENPSGDGYWRTLLERHLDNKAHVDRGVDLVAILVNDRPNRAKLNIILNQTLLVCDFTEVNLVVVLSQFEDAKVRMEKILQNIDAFGVLVNTLYKDIEIVLKMSAEEFDKCISDPFEILIDGLQSPGNTFRIRS